MRLSASSVSLQMERALRKAGPGDHRARVSAISNPSYERFEQPGALFLLPKTMQTVPLQRLIILVPSESFSISEFIVKIGRYALPGTSILFVARATDPEVEYILRMRMILLVNLVRSPFLQVHSQLFSHGSWLEIVKDIWRSGDVVICLSDQKLRHLMFRSTFLGIEIFTDLQIPVLVQQDVRIFDEPAPHMARREIAAWGLFIATILGVFYLQVQIAGAVSGWLNQVLLILTFIVALALISKINDFFG